MDKEQYLARLKETWAYLNQVEIKGSQVYSMFQAMVRVEALIVDLEKPEEKPKEEANDL